MRALFAAFLALCPGPVLACGLELVLAMDVSRSVTNAEYDLQMNGLSAAFRHPDVAEAIAWTPGGVMAVVTQWSGPDSQARSVPWMHLEDADDAARFATAIDRQDRAFFAAYTAIGEALYHARTVSATNPRRCSRRVIDVSGDGASNRGRPARLAAEELASGGYTINALVIRGARPDPAEYYARNVIRGSGAFIEEAQGFDDYARAIRVKLIREMNPQLAAGQ